MKLDIRFGAKPKLVYLAPGEELMRVPEEIVDSVIFLCEDTEGKGRREDMRPVGTAFVIAIPFPGAPVSGRGLGFRYLVTARHVIEGLADQGGFIHARIQREDRTLDFVRNQVSSWWLHKDADIAVTPFPVPLSAANCKSLNADSFLISEKEIDRLKIGAGDAVFTAGLFTGHPGQNRNIPIVRIGSLAVTGEQRFVNPRYKKEMAVYLVEMFSKGGQSGSPVFVYLEALRRPSMEEAWVPSPEDPVGAGSFYLIGVMTGGWRTQFMSLGISTVAPARYIKDLLDQDEARRQQILAERAEEGTLETTGAFKEQEGRLAAADLDPGVSEDQFEKFLGRATKKKRGGK